MEWYIFAIVGIGALFVLGYIVFYAWRCIKWRKLRARVAPIHDPAIMESGHIQNTKVLRNVSVKVDVDDDDQSSTTSLSDRDDRSQSDRMRPVAGGNERILVPPISGSDSETDVETDDGRSVEGLLPSELDESIFGMTLPTKNPRSITDLVMKEPEVEQLDMDLDNEAAKTDSIDRVIEAGYNALIGAHHENNNSVQTHPTVPQPLDSRSSTATSSGTNVFEIESFGSSRVFIQQLESTQHKTSPLATMAEGDHVSGSRTEPASPPTLDLAVAPYDPLKDADYVRLADQLAQLASETEEWCQTTAL